MEGATLATIGGGNVVVGGVALDEHEDFSGLNRDIDKGQIVTVDQQTGALNGSFSVDHRLLSGTGRQVIADQHVDLKNNFKMTIGGATADIARAGIVVGGMLEASQIGNALDKIAGSQRLAHTEDGELAGQVEGIREGTTEDAWYTQYQLNRADEVVNDGEGERVKVIVGAISPDGNSVAGATNQNTDTLYLDIGDQQRNEIVNTLVHEGMHLDGAGHWMASFTGFLGGITYNVNTWANSDNIAQHKPAAIYIFDTASNQQLLSQNLYSFANDALSGDLEYRQLKGNEFSFLLDPDRVSRFATLTGQSDSEARRELVSSSAAAMDGSWARALSGHASNTSRARAFLSEELEIGTSLFQVTPAQFDNSREGLREMMGDPVLLQMALDNLALVDPATYRHDPAYRQQIWEAKGAGSGAGIESLGSGLLGVPQALSGMAGWALYAIGHPGQAVDQVGNGISGAFEDFRYRGHEDALRIMQGDVYGVEFDNAKGATEFGIGLGASSVGAFRLWDVETPTRDVVLSTGVDDFVAGLYRIHTPTHKASGRFEVEQTGPYNYRVLGGDTAVDIDGYDGSTMLDAKFVEKPERSPYVDDSRMPEFLRTKIMKEQEHELQRYNALIKDPKVPFDRLNILTNEQRAVPYFQSLMDQLQVPGSVMVVDTKIPQIIPRKK